jgi:hypothetical protein
MKTPAGKECHFYYQDFHRGHSTQECRLIDQNPTSEAWKPEDCTACPVPGILLANSSPHLVLEGAIKKGFMGFNRRVHIRASCSRHLVDVPEPYVGCSQCAQERPGLRNLFADG